MNMYEVSKIANSPSTTEALDAEKIVNNSPLFIPTLYH